MLGDQHTYTQGGKMQEMEISVICTWIKEAWDDIPHEMLAYSFRKCGITNALDCV